MRGTPVRFLDFRGGLNKKAQPYLVAPNEARDCLNVVSTVRGSIRKRNGIETFCPADEFTGIDSLHSCFASEATNKLVVVGKDKFFEVLPIGEANDKTGSHTITEGVPWEFIDAPEQNSQGPVYGMNGEDDPLYWDGDSDVGKWTASSGTLPNGRFLVYFANRVWVAGVASDPSALYFSNIADPTDWPAENIVRFDPNDGDEITGLGTVGPYLIVFKRQKMFLVYDLDTGANRSVSSGIGCVSHRSIVETPVGTFFLASDGVYRFDGAKLELTSEKITPLIEDITETQKAMACGGYLDDHYYLSIPIAGATTNDLTLDYDIRLESWWPHSNAAADFTIWEPETTRHLFAVKTDTPVVDRCYVEGVLKDNDKGFPAYWTGPWIAFGEPYRRKRVREARIDGKGRVDVYMAKDFQRGAEIVKRNVFPAPSTKFGVDGVFGGEGVFGDRKDVGIAKLPSLGVARAFSFTFQHDAGDEAAEMEIDSFALLYFLRRD